MAISKVNPVETSAGAYAFVCNVPTSGSGVNYIFSGEFDAGIYTISCISTSIINITFYSGSNIVGTGQTLNGVGSLTISSPATSVKLRSDTGTDVLVSIEKTGEPLPSGSLGVIDTITTTSTYNCPSASRAIACVIGGGGGGGRAWVWPTPVQGGGGGGSGFATIEEITPGQSYSAVIGSGGTGRIGGTNATAGGQSSLGSVSANGGDPGGNATSQYSAGIGGSGGSRGGNGGTNGNYGVGGSNGTPGSGVSISDFASTSPQPSGTQNRGRGGLLYNGGNGAAGAAQSVSPNAAANTGGGGGGSGRNADNGGNGGSGIIYVLRWS